MVRLALVALPVAFLIASISGCGSAAVLKNDVTESVYAYCESEDAQIKAVPFLDSVILKGEPLLRRF